MWAALGGGVVEETRTDSEKPKESGGLSKTEKAADLNAALLECVGEDEHKILRANCASLMKKELSTDKFHSYCLNLFQKPEGGMKLYRRLVLSFPDGDKRAMLLSLVDEAVATANRPPTAKESNPEVSGGEKDSKETEEEATASTTAAATTTDAAATANTPAVEGDDKSKGAEDVKATEGEVVNEEDVTALIHQKKQAVSSKEKAILTVMARRQEDLAKEKRALDMIRSEMAALSRQQSNEITELMESLGETDKDLWYLERDFKAAEAEYLKCKTRYDKMKHTKTQMVAQLTSLTLNAERRKEEKLNEIMEKLKKDGVVFPGAALAGIADE
jgi:hypothetical protein